MLPLSFQVPASVVLLVGGAIACFGGYRLFRLVLAVYGFILGALMGSSMAGAAETWMVLAAAFAGGTLGALALMAGYFVGVALLGAGLGVLIVNLAWRPFGGEPHIFALVLAAAVGAFAALSFQRYVIIVGTAFGGAWTMLVGAAALLGGRGAKAGTAAGDVWAVYPDTAVPDRLWVLVAWVGISLVGMYVQLHAARSGSSRKKK